jgi:superfamily II DNA or RNA helicase
MVQIILGNVKAKVVGLKNVQIIRELDYLLSYEVQGFQYMSAYKNWDGRHKLFDKRQTFPIGLLYLVEKTLKEHNEEYEIKDERGLLSYGDEYVLNTDSKYRPRDYQLDFLNKAQQHGSGVIKSPTGSGKTLMISMLVAKFNIKTVIYVIGIELLYQMKRTLEEAYPGMEVGLVGDGKCEIKNITVATIWSAASAFNEKVVLEDNETTPDKEENNKSLNKEAVRKMVNEAEMFILDEAHYSGASTVQMLSKHSSSAKHRFLFSGTPWRETGDDILIDAVGGPRIFDINASYLIDRNYLVPPKIYFIDVPQKKNVGSNYQEIYQNYVVDNQERNELIVKSTLRLIEDKRKVLILVTKVSHGKKLLSLLENNVRVFSLDGKNTSRARMDAIDEMQAGKLDVIIASKIFDQGIDIPELSALILAGPQKSTGRTLQRIGRVIRGAPDKKDAIIVDFMDNCKYLKNHSAVRRKVYETEPRFKIIGAKNK